MNDRPVRRTHSMTPRDRRVVRAFLELNSQWSNVVDQIVAGGLPDDDRRRLAHTLRLIADDVEPKVTPPDDAGDSGSR